MKNRVFFSSAEEAARWFGVSSSAIKQWISAGHIQASKSKGRWRRIRFSELQRFLDSRKVPQVASDRNASQKTSDAVLALIDGTNHLNSIVEAVQREGLFAKISLRIGDQPFTKTVSRDIVDRLDLRPGDDVVVMVNDCSLGRCFHDEG